MENLELGKEFRKRKSTKRLSSAEQNWTKTRPFSQDKQRRQLYLTCRHQPAGASKISVGVKRRKPSRRERRATAVSRAQRKGGEEGGGGGRRGRDKRGSLTRRRVESFYRSSAQPTWLSCVHGVPFHTVEIRSLQRRLWCFQRERVGARDGEGKEVRGRGRNPEEDPKKCRPTKNGSTDDFNERYSLLAPWPSCFRGKDDCSMTECLRRCVQERRD